MTKKPVKRSLLFRLGVSLLLVVVAAELGLRAYVAVRGLDRSELATLLEPTTAENSYGAELSTLKLLKLSRFDDRVYELEPGLRGSFASKLFHTNSSGFRGRERSEEKPAGTLRIVGLGDDQMLGLGVAEGQSYLDLLERQLNERASEEVRYEALNFAVAGYNTAMQVATFEHAARHFDPDLVVLHYVGDDVNLPRFLPAALGDSSPSYLYDFLRALVSPVEDPGDNRTLKQAARVGKKQRDAMEEKYDYMRGVEGVALAFERLAGATSELDIPVVVVMLGDGDNRRAAAREAAESHGFLVINAVPQFGEYLAASGREETREEWRRLFFMADGRPTTDAHRAWAGLLEQTIAELGL
jgi:hypothetical protein